MIAKFGHTDYGRKTCPTKSSFSFRKVKMAKDEPTNEPHENKQ